MDGKTALVGGHNMWTRHYLEAAPVHDLSMQISGSAALHASQFAAALWRHACQPPVALGSVATTSGFPDASVGCAESHDPAPIATGTTRVVTVGRLGALGDNAADDAIVALLDAAHATLRLSLQDIRPVGFGDPWPESYLRALASAIGRGVDVEIVVIEHLDARPDGLAVGSAAYSNGWTPMDLAQRVAAYAVANPDVMAGANVASAMCGHLHVAPLRMGPDDVWPNGATLANHPKLVIADDAAFYLGSQNWYPANLFELGYIVDDATATHQLVDAYYAKVWSASSRVAVSVCP